MEASKHKRFGLNWYAFIMPLPQKMNYLSIVCEWRNLKPLVEVTLDDDFQTWASCWHTRLLEDRFTDSTRKRAPHCTLFAPKSTFYREDKAASVDLVPIVAFTSYLFFCSNG